MLDATVELGAGIYRLGEAGAERDAPIGAVRIDRWPVANASFARFVEATWREVRLAREPKLAEPLLAEHPATDVTYEDATNPNLYAAIAATVNFISRQPRVFAETLGRSSARTWRGCTAST